MKAVKMVLFLTHLLVGVLALFGGWAGMSVPNGPFGISTDMLANSPFDNFFIPGLVLFVMVGLGQLFSAGFFIFRSRYQAYVSGFFSGVLLVWLIVQVWMLQVIEILHVVTFIIALLQAGLSIWFLFKEKLFPANRRH